jgi:hypothetical protein
MLLGSQIRRSQHSQVPVPPTTAIPFSARDPDH